jgi:hypothetical protein
VRHTKGQPRWKEHEKAANKRKGRKDGDKTRRPKPARNRGRIPTGVNRSEFGSWSKRHWRRRLKQLKRKHGKDKG